MEGVGLVHIAADHFRAHPHLVIADEFHAELDHQQLIEVFEHIDRHQRKGQEQHDRLVRAGMRQTAQQLIPPLAVEPVGGDEDVHKGQDQRNAEEIHRRLHQLHKKQAQKQQPLPPRENIAQLSHQLHARSSVSFLSFHIIIVYLPQKVKGSAAQFGRQLRRSASTQLRGAVKWLL